MSSIEVGPSSSTDLHSHPFRGLSAPFFRLISAILLCVCLNAVLYLSAAGQSYKGGVLGTITDKNGAAVAGARVALSSVSNGSSFATASDENGKYSIRSLAPGGYSLRISAAGFGIAEVRDVSVQVDQLVRVDVTILAGPVDAQVLVHGTGAPIETESASLGKVISNKEIEDIPLNGRNYLDLALLSPGVVAAAAGANPHNINGSRADHVGYLVDGVANANRRGSEPVVALSVGAIQEFRIVTNAYSAEYSRGGVISVALATGGNRFRGSLFEYHRNAALDARSYFDPERLKLVRNQFGGSVSGPIAKDRSFLLASYEGLRNRQGGTRITRVPNIAERNGVFASAIRNPFTGQNFAGNAINPSLISSIARALLDYFPLPNRAGAANYAALGTTAEDRDGLILKFDHLLNARDQVSVKALSNRIEGTDPFRSSPIPGFGSTRSALKQLWSVSVTSSISENLVNEARAGFTYDRFDESSVNSGMNTSSDLGILGTANSYGLAEIVIAGFGTLGDGSFLPDRWTDKEFTLADTLTIVRGGHTVRLGGDFQRSSLKNLFASFAGGQIAFNGTFTRDPFADFLLGLPVQTQRQVGTNTTRLSNDYYGIFVQDDWQVYRNLTLNLGLRYDLIEPAVEHDDHWANFIIERRGPVAAGSEGYPRAVLKTPRNNVSPRVGFAWRPFGGGKTAFRAGYGIFRSFDLLFTQYQIMGASAFPFTRLELYQATSVGNPSLAVPFPNRPGQTPGALNPNGWDYENPTPYLQAWNLTFSRKLFGELGVEVSYVGSKGTHLSSTANINQPLRTPSGSLTRFPGLGRILFQRMGANSSYNAMQISVSKRLSGGLSFRSALTWSKSIDNASFGSPARLPQDPNNAAAERALSDFDRRRVWNSDFTYELPFGQGRRWGRNWDRTVTGLLGGWQLNGLIQLYDGRPFSVTVGRANALQGFATRPDRIGSGELDDPTTAGWFDTSAFVVVPNDAFRFGNSGRNILTGPGTVLIDISFFKTFSLPWEGQRLQLRTEVFNLPNRANFGQPDGRIDFATAGAITSAGPGRQIQLAVKYLF